MSFLSGEGRPHFGGQKSVRKENCNYSGMAIKPIKPLPELLPLAKGARGTAAFISWKQAAQSAAFPGLAELLPDLLILSKNHLCVELLFFGLCYNNIYITWRIMALCKMRPAGGESNLYALTGDKSCYPKNDPKELTTGLIFMPDVQRNCSRPDIGKQR